MDKLIKLSILNLIITVSLAFYLEVDSTGSKSYLLCIFFASMLV